MTREARAAQYDAVVVGAGPNGLCAAITLAQAGRRVLVREAAPVVGGGLRTEELTLPGFHHDTFSAVHPLAVASPFLRTLPLASYGLQWLHSPAAVAHPFDDGTAALLERSLEATGETLGSAADAAAYSRLLAPFVDWSERFFAETLAPLHAPRHPLLLARFGLVGLPPITWLTRRLFQGTRARALLGGIAAHVTMPPHKAPTAAFALLLAIAGHTEGWPIPKGGAGRLAEALAGYLRSLGGEIVTGAPVTTLDELPPARAVLLDLTPKQVLDLGGTRLPEGYRRQLERYRYGLAAFKVDWALSGLIPWKSAACARAATVHLGGTLSEIETSERAAWRGRAAEWPYLILAQPSRFDPTRAPAGKHTAWGYGHVPFGARFTPQEAQRVVDRMEAQIERFAPGFRDLVLARSVLPPLELERRNANLVGGDIAGGLPDLRQLFFRPVPSLDPYATPVDGLYLCSASTPPGAGIHGMCGYWAARSALKRLA